MGVLWELYFGGGGGLVALGSPLPPLSGGKGKNTNKGINEGFSLLEVCRIRLHLCSGFSQKTSLHSRNLIVIKHGNFLGDAHAPWSKNGSCHF
jgi:hypothetical protein